MAITDIMLIPLDSNKHEIIFCFKYKNCINNNICKEKWKGFAEKITALKSVVFELGYISLQVSLKEGQDICEQRVTSTEIVPY